MDGCCPLHFALICISRSYHGLLPLVLISTTHICLFCESSRVTIVHAVRNLLAFCSLFVVCGVVVVVVGGGGDGLCVGVCVRGGWGLKGFWKTVICILKIFKRFVLFNFACLSLSWH